MSKELFTQELLDEILEILKRGDTCELKKIKDEIVLVEIRRKVKIKTPTNG